MDLSMLKSMANDLKSYKRDRYVLLEYYINKRLTKSVEQYYKELDNSLSYLASKNVLRVAKKFKKVF